MCSAHGHRIDDLLSHQTFLMYSRTYFPIPVFSLLPTDFLLSQIMAMHVAPPHKTAKCVLHNSKRANMTLESLLCICLRFSTSSM